MNPKPLSTPARVLSICRNTVICVFLIACTPANSSGNTSALCESGVPVGTIIASVVLLPDNDKKVWKPADGTIVSAGTRYHTVYGERRLPDLRAMFLRGTNDMGGDNGPQTDPKLADPDGFRKPGGEVPQMSINRKHSHTIGLTHAGMTPNVVAAGGGSGSGKIELPAGSSNESRPNNISVYYYIKVDC